MDVKMSEKLKRRRRKAEQREEVEGKTDNTKTNTTRPRTLIG